MLKNWKRRKLTFWGKSTIIQNFIIPKITYLAAVQSVDNTKIKHLEQMVYGYIWDGKIDKIKRNVIISDYENGGLHIRDIETHIHTLRVSWVKRFLDTDSSASWTIIPSMYYDNMVQITLFLK